MTPNLKVSDPVAEASTEATKSEGFTPATEAREEARKSFHAAVDQLLNQAIKGGQCKLELNITEAEPNFVKEVRAELEAAGYALKDSTQVKGAYGQKILTVSF